ncbi:MAG TPA: YihY/virulence factor BrkB family protein, partial [Polyangia bacterium]|nr:YihY/virulence factor BrkB family protein [Polyangia bacterium]
ARAGAGLRKVRRGVWQTDRTRLGAWAALVNRGVRSLTWTASGLVRDRLSMRAAALTYYTIFSLIPVLVLVIWIGKAMHLSPRVVGALGRTGDGPLAGNQMLRSGALRIVQAVDRAAQTTDGVIGVAGVLYAAARLLRNMEQSLNAIAGVGQRRPRYVRLLGYLVLVLLPAASLIVAAGLTAAHKLVGSQALQSALHVVRQAVPAGAGLALLVTWCGLTALYATAARAELQLGSCAVGAAVATLLLAGVLWAFVRFQIGAARAGAVHAGLSAGPVLLLLVYFSWYVTLIGAEVAVGNDVDRTLARGAYTWRLDAVGQSWAALAVMAAVARATARNGGPDPRAKDLAGEIKLFPQALDSLCGLLVARGLLVETGAGQYRLNRPATEIAVATIFDAVNRDPSLDVSRDRLKSTLRPCAQAGTSLQSSDEVTLDRLALP